MHHNHRSSHATNTPASRRNDGGLPCSPTQRQRDAHSLGVYLGIHGSLADRVGVGGDMRGTKAKAIRRAVYGDFSPRFREYTVQGAGLPSRRSFKRWGKWLAAMWLIGNCKNGISSWEIHRALGVTQKTAWFMLHRVRLAVF